MPTTDITTTTDRELQSALFYIDVRLAEHLEMDCEGGGEFECAQCDADRAFRTAINTEIARRQAEGIEIHDPEDSVEVQLAPYGPEWQREQDERRGR